MRHLSISRLSAGAALIVIAFISVAAATTDPAAAVGAPDHSTAAAVTPGAPAMTRADAAGAADVVSAAMGATAMSAADPDSAVLASADAALRALESRVKRSSRADALRTAFQAYYNFRVANPDDVRKPYLYYVDMGLDNGTARGYVFDMDRLTVVDGPFTVAHGSGSSRSRNAVPTSFSNRPGSKATSLGLYVAQETYAFHGKSGGRRYSSVGLRMRGESGSFNGAARARGIVAHGAPYVTADQAGRSQGCPAMEMRRAQRLLPMIANGGVVFIYSPHDAGWLNNDPWILDS